MTSAQTTQFARYNAQFSIEPEDFAFFTKMEVPAPTWCPQCRMQRRMIWRNERSLYPATCAATGKQMLSMFSPQSKAVVYDRSYWWSDQWDQRESGQDYDFSKPFFQQFKELLERAPLPNLANTNVENSEHGNHNADCKDCYLLYASMGDEHVNFSRGAVECRDSADLYICDHVEQCYDSLYLANCYNLAHSSDIDDSSDCDFTRQSKNLDQCLGCINLQHRRYHIFNKEYSPEEYAAKLGEYDLGNYANLQLFQQEFEAFIKPYPRRFASISTTENCTGHMMMRSKNVQFGFDIFGGVEDSKYLALVVSLKDSYDCYGAGAGAELLYEAVDSGINGYQDRFTVYVHHCNTIDYSYACHNSTNLFGCVGLNHKQYCILNKQYTKEEYEELVPKIIQHMHEMPYTDAKGRTYTFGEFFPPEISPFAYNETLAHEHYPLTESEVEEFGARWTAPRTSQHPVTIKAADLPDHIKDVDDSILSEVIECQHKQECNEQCTQAFKIQPQELAFYIKHNYPLPRLCLNCRHYSRLAKRLPFQLWERQCQCAGTTSQRGDYTNQTEHIHGDQPCQVVFQTPYDPARPETIYCKHCINEETV